MIAVGGEVDAHTAPRLRAALDRAFADAGARPVVLDLTDVSFLGSRGLTALVDAHRAASAASPLRVVVDHTRPVIRPIHLLGLEGVLSLFRNVEDALRDQPHTERSSGQGPANPVRCGEDGSGKAH